MIKLQRSLIVHFWLVKLQFTLILQSCHFCPFRRQYLILKCYKPDEFITSEFTTCMSENILRYKAFWMTLRGIPVFKAMYQQLYRSYNTQILYKYIYRILRAKQIYNVYEGVILKSCTSPTPRALLNKGYFLCGFWYSDLFLTCLLQKQRQSPSKTKKIFTQSLEWLTWAGAFWRSVHRELCVSPRCVRCVGRWPPVSDQS